MSDRNETPNVLVRLKYYPYSGGSNYSNRRQLYASGIADDYMKYIDKGIAGDGNDYMDYVGNDEKSSGVFGKDGFLSKADKAKMRKQLRKTESVIWDMVISFKEGYGERNIRDAATAQTLLKAQLNKFFKSAGLNPDNVTWFAGLHTNTDNAHLHVCFFEKEPMYLRRGHDGKHFHHGKLRQSGIDGFKLSVEQYFSDTTMQLKTERAEIIATAKDSLNHDKKLKNRVSALADLLPPTGKLGYDSENMKPLRHVIDGITDHILFKYPSASKAYLKLAANLRERDNEIYESCRLQRIKNVDDFLVSDKVMSDLYRRIGNHVIQKALAVKKRKEKNRQARKSQASPARRKIARRDLLGSLVDCLTLAAIAEEECKRDFEEYLERLEEAAPEIEYERQYENDMEM